MYLALKKCKNDCKTLKITLTSTEFCPLKPEIAPSSIGFRLNSGICFVNTRSSNDEKVP